MESTQLIESARKFVARFVDLNEEEFSFFVQMLEIRDFDKKVVIAQEGQVEKYLNFIWKGLARKFFFKNKEEMVTQIAKENELISSYESFLSELPSNYVVETIEPTTFISITKQSVERMYASNPKMERLGRLVTTQQFLDKQRWDYDRVRLSSHERFIRFIGENSDLLQRVPQKYLASYLNIKPETFSRFKHLLKKKR